MPVSRWQQLTHSLTIGGSGATSFRNSADSLAPAVLNNAGKTILKADTSGSALILGTPAEAALRVR